MVRELPRMPDTVGNGSLVRNKQFTITGPDDGVFRAQASLVDGQHTMEVSLAVQVETMEVLEVKGCITIAPHRVCPQAVDGLRALVGMRLRPGLFGEMQRRVGGPRGCIHVNDLIRESLQLIAAHRNLTEIRRMRGEGRTDEDILEWGEEVRTWTCVAAPDPVARPAAADPSE